jgi:hypothetical protein
MPPFVLPRDVGISVPTNPAKACKDPNHTHAVKAMNISSRSACSFPAPISSEGGVQMATRAFFVPGHARED